MNCHHKLHNVLDREWERERENYLHGFMQKQKLTLGWNLSKSFSHLRSLKSEMWRCACKAKIGRLLTSTTPEPPQHHICVFTIREAAGRFIKTASEMEWAFSKQCHVFNPNRVSYCSKEFKWFPLWRYIHYRHHSILNQDMAG